MNIVGRKVVRKGIHRDLLIRIPNSVTEVVAPKRYLRGVTATENKRSGGTTVRSGRGRSA